MKLEDCLAAQAAELPEKPVYTGADLIGAPMVGGCISRVEMTQCKRPYGYVPADSTVRRRGAKRARLEAEAAEDEPTL